MQIVRWTWLVLALCAVMLVPTTSSQAQPFDDPTGVIVFTSDRNVVVDVYAQDLSNGRIWQLTNDRDVESDPIISPNGKQVLFALETDTGLSDIYSMNIDGSNRRNLTNTPDYAESHPALSADGQRLAVARSEAGTDRQTVVVYDLTSPDTDYQVNFVGYSAQDSSFAFPAWTQDDAALLMTGTNDAGAVGTLAINDSIVVNTLLAADDFALRYPRYSPDFSSIVAVQVFPGEESGSLVLIDHATNSITSLGASGRYLSAVWLPDGQGFIAARATPLGARIVQLNASGENIGELISEGDTDAAPFYAPISLPDVERPTSDNYEDILTVPDLPPDPAELTGTLIVNVNNDLYAQSLDGSEVTQLTFTPDEYDGFARVSRDGTMLAYAPRGLSSESISLLNLEDGTITTLYEADTVEALAWSPDSQQIMFSAGEGLDSLDILVYDLRTGTVRSIIDDPTVSEDLPDWSDRGKIVYSVNTDSGGIALVLNDTNGLFAQTLVEDPFDSALLARFRPGTNTVAFILEGSGPSFSDLVLINTTTGAQQRLTNGEGYYFPIWSPDGSVLLAQTFDNEGLVILFDPDTGERVLLRSIEGVVMDWAP